MCSDRSAYNRTNTFKIFPDCFIHEFLTRDGFSRLFFVVDFQQSNFNIKQIHLHEKTEFSFN
jgi:hypothetical protein